MLVPEVYGLPDIGGSHRAKIVNRPLGYNKYFEAKISHT